METNLKIMNEELKQSINNLNTKGVDMTKVDLEEQAIDKEAYNQWMKFLKLPQLTTQRNITCSDGRLAKLGAPLPTLQRMIAGLGDDEVSMIIAKKKTHDVLLMKANNLKRKAFGLNRVANGKPKMISHLFDSRRLEMIELFGRMFSVQEVHQVCLEEWKIPVDISQVAKFRATYSEMINEKIKAHQTGFADIRLGVKRSRLEEYCWIYNESKTKYQRVASREDLKVMITVLDKIKDETEGAQVNVNVSGQVDIEVAVNQHVQREVMKGLSMRQLIIGRVAGRMGSNPAILIDRLTKSYYSKFATMDADEVEEIPYEEVKYPTKEPYDFDRIKGLNEGIVAQTAQIVNQTRTEQYRNSESVKKLGVKEAMLAMIQGERAKVLAVRSNADAIDLNRNLEKTVKVSTLDRIRALAKG